MRIGSLFSGIGGLELGLERSIPGARVVWQAESEPFCRQVLAKHWPDVRRFIDVRQVQRGRAEAVDIVCGGFPCQDISLAGSGAGIEGSRSGLWGEFARIVDELRPRFVVVENVAALRRRGLDRVLGDLASGGYDAIWDCIPAAAVGAPHRRDRLYLVAWRVSNPDRGILREQPERGGVRPRAANKRNPQPQHVGNIGSPDNTVADPDTWRRQVQRVAHQCRQQRPRRDEPDGRNGQTFPPGSDDLHAWRRVPATAQPSICRVAYGVPNGVDRDRLRALGNAVVPQVAEVIGGVVAELASRVARGEVG